MIKIKRIYKEADKSDGTRILVDRLWPRGLSREKAKVDLWLKDIAPSDELRKWFSHDPEKWEVFKLRYFEELKGKQEHVTILKEKAPFRIRMNSFSFFDFYKEIVDQCPDQSHENYHGDQNIIKSY